MSIKNDTVEQAAAKEGTLATAVGDSSVYLDMRKAMLEIKPEDFGFNASASTNKVFGIVLDWNQNDTICTVSGFKTSDVSVYYSTGMLYMAGVQVASFRDMAQSFVEKSQTAFEKSEPAANQDLPKPGMAKFYFITPNGLYHYEEVIEVLKSTVTESSDLFSFANHIASEYKKATGK